MQGPYLGAITGFAFSQFNSSTATQSGSLLNSAQADVANQAGKQQINTTGFLGGVEGGYIWQRNQFVLGLEADLQSLSTVARLQRRCFLSGTTE